MTEPSLMTSTETNCLDCAWIGDANCSRGGPRERGEVQAQRTERQHRAQAHSERRRQIAEHAQGGPIAVTTDEKHERERYTAGHETDDQDGRQPPRSG